jgi:hypothetical protein
MKPRLRERPLTAKPRIIVAHAGQFYVERATPGGPFVVLQRTFAAAINLASQWAHERPLEAP